MKIIDTKMVVIALIFLHATGLYSEATEPLRFVAEPTQLAEWTIEVSSRLQSQGGNSYGPENLLSGPKTAWVEGVATDGKGEWIKIIQADGKESMKFRSIFLLNGYQKSKKIFEANGRVLEFAVSWAGGSERIKVADVDGEQTLRLSHPVDSPWVRFEIIKVASGSKYSDTAISGISLDLEEFNYPPEGDSTQSVKPGKAPSSVPNTSLKTFSHTASGKVPTAKQILKLIIGQWDGGRHITDYRKDGTFLFDPEPGDDPVGIWSIKGNVLIKKFGSEKPERTTVLSITEEKMVIRSSAGKEYVIRKVKKN